MFKKYSDVIRELKNLDIKWSKKLLYACVSILISLIIVSGPICLFLNLMIFHDAQKLLGFAVATCLIIFVTLVHYIYLKSITNGNITNLKVVYLTDIFIFSIVVYMVLIFLFLLGVI